MTKVHKMDENYEEIINKRTQMMNVHGWVVDAIHDTKDFSCDTETGVDIHTHGIQESFDHPDLQCILPADINIIHSIFCIIVENIKRGKKYESGKCYGDILNNGYKLRFIEATQGGRRVLRVILPDRKGKLHKNLMQKEFQIQYNGIKYK